MRGSRTFSSRRSRDGVLTGKRLSLVGPGSSQGSSRDTLMVPPLYSTRTYFGEGRCASSAPTRPATHMTLSQVSVIQGHRREILTQAAWFRVLMLPDGFLF